MKIRTIADCQNLIDADWEWRKKELSILNKNIEHSSTKPKDAQFRVALRAGITLLYAHWEGFIKNSATFYLEFLNQQKLKLNELNQGLLSLALRYEFEAFDEARKPTAYVKFINLWQNHLGKEAKFFPEKMVKTESNLNTAVLKEILVSLNLESSFFETKTVIIDTQLLKRRNSIAHGENLEDSDLPIDVKGWKALYGHILAMVGHFSALLLNALVQKKYLLSS